MPTSPNEDGRPTQGGAALPVHIMNPGSISGGGGSSGPSTNVAVTNFPASQAVTIADGADVAEGVTTDAAVVTDTTGTLSGKLRGLVKWAFERMPASLGQKAMAASFPVSIASDQSALPVTGTFFQATQPVSGTVTADTELPAAAALADATVNPTAPAVGSFLHGMNATTWDRLRTAVGDAMAATGLLAIGNMLWNGVTWDRHKGDNTGAARVSLYGQGTLVGDRAVKVNAGNALYVAQESAAFGTSDSVSNSAHSLVSAASNELYQRTYPYVFNGVTWDRKRSNHEVTALASAARTALVNSSDLVNYNSRGVAVTIDITAYTAGSLTATIKYKDTLSGKYITLLASAALAAAATTTLIVYPGVTVAANVAASAPLPRVWRVEMTVGDATSITYSVSANFIN